MDRFDRPRQALAIAVAFLAGAVDALGFLTGDSYFVSFMSGNTTRLAVDVVVRPSRAIVPALLIVGFVAGVAGGSVIAAKAGAKRKPALLATITLLLFAAAAFHTFALTSAALGAMVLAMGAVNNTFQREGSVAVGLTYMTGALVRLGQAIGGRTVGAERGSGTAYALLWAGLFSGAVAGAMLFTLFNSAAFWGAGLLAAILVFVSTRFSAQES